jgi:lipocalin
MKGLFAVVLAAVLMPGLVFAQTRRVDATPIKNFDLYRFLGLWYEIARFDHKFERDMINVKAEYVLRDDGKLDVVNSGWKNGRYKSAIGMAKQPNPMNNPARLRVSFFLFFYSDYRVLMLDNDYQYALVGSRGSDYLWILSRTPSIPKDVKKSILKEASRLGYDTSKLIWVDQSANMKPV